MENENTFELAEKTEEVVDNAVKGLNFEQKLLTDHPILASIGSGLVAGAIAVGGYYLAGWLVDRVHAGVEAFREHRKAKAAEKYEANVKPITFEDND